MDIPTALVVERRRCVFLQQLRIPDRMPKGCAQIVRDRVSKGFQFIVARFEFRRPLGEFLIEMTNLVLPLLAVFDLELKLLGCLVKIRFDSASNVYERSNDHRPSYEEQKVRYIGAGNLKGIKGLGK